MKRWRRWKWFSKYGMEYINWSPPPLNPNQTIIVWWSVSVYECSASVFIAEILAKVTVGHWLNSTNFGSKEVSWQAIHLPLQTRSGILWQGQKNNYHERNKISIYGCTKARYMKRLVHKTLSKKNRKTQSIGRWTKKEENLRNEGCIRKTSQTKTSWQESNKGEVLTVRHKFKGLKGW